MGTGGSSSRVRAALGGETARSGARYRPFEVSPAQCLPASACRYARIPAGGAIAVVGDGRRPSPAAHPGTPGRSAAAVGSARGVSDRAAAPGRASASWAQPAAAAGSDVARQGALVELGASSALDEGAPVDLRGPRTGAGLPEGRRIPPRHGVRTHDSVSATYDSVRATYDSVSATRSSYKWSSRAWALVCPAVPARWYLPSDFRSHAWQSSAR